MNYDVRETGCILDTLDKEQGDGLLI